MTNPTGSGRGLQKKGLKILLLCLIISCICSYTAQSQKTSTLWFNSNGQLISYPPEWLNRGDELAAKLSFDNNFWTARTAAVLNSWLDVLVNLKKGVPQGAVYTFGDGSFKDVEAEMACKMIDLVYQTTYLSPEQKTYYLNRINLLAITAIGNCNNVFMPAIGDLIEPKFEMVYFFYDSNGGRINLQGEPYCAGDDTAQPFRICKSEKEAGGTGSMTTNPVTIPAGCHEVRYQLRAQNNIAVAIMRWMVNSSVVYPKGYKDEIIKRIEQDFGEDFIKQQQSFQQQLDVLSETPSNMNIRLKPIEAFITAGFSHADTIIGKLKTTSAGNQYRNWVARWLWLTGGIPQMNPLTMGTAIFPDNKTGTKASPQEKALYQIFESMVTKGAVRIGSLPQLDTGFKNIPRIKAAMDAEASQQTGESTLQDRLLYSGMLKSSTGKRLLMRHIDVLNNFTVMGMEPIKEITEDERLYILVENKSIPVKLSVAFETVAIAAESSDFTDELAQTDIKAKQMPDSTLQPESDALRRDSIINLTKKMKELAEKAKALRALPLAPSASIYFEKDQTPDLMTDILEHDYLFDAPANATYSVKQTNPDNTEKEVAKGSYRINKLYHFRLKAGVVYSFLRKSDFTETSPGNYTLDDPASGIDGTFGIQYFFNKQDIRSKDIKPRSFFYVGLSMKNITENFYLGLGLEPVCGLAIGVNAHIGRREALTGKNNFPTGTSATWGIHVAPAILIDPSLFVRLFTFGNTNRSLIGF